MDDPHEEITQTESSEGETQTFIEAPMLSDTSDEVSTPELDLELDEPTVGMEEGVMENRAFRKIQKPQTMVRKYQPVHRPHASGDFPQKSHKFERSTFYTAVILILVGLIGFSLFAVLRLLNK